MCQTVLKKEVLVWKEKKCQFCTCTNMNPAPPNLYAMMVLHKPNTPIRQIIRWKNALAYQLVKHLSQALCNYSRLPYTQQCTQLHSTNYRFKTAQINKDTRIYSYDIGYMYTNIPRVDVTLKMSLNISENIQSDIQWTLIHRFLWETWENYEYGKMGHLGTIIKSHICK